MSCDCDYVLDKHDVQAQHYSTCSALFGATEKKGLRNPDGTLRLNNKHLESLKVDVLYHLGLDTANYDIPAQFGDVKFVCLGGTKHRMREFAKYMANVLGLPKEMKLDNLTKHSQRYAMYKAGPVLSVSHGIGIPSMATALQEVIKLMHYAKAKDPIFFRLGTCGGLGIPAGSVVVSAWGLNGTLEKTYDVPVLGKMRRMPSYLDERLSQEVHHLTKDIKDFNTYIAGTMAADDFYRGQARLDGPFCDYTESDKMAFLRTLADMGVKNIEMEANAFAAITAEAGVRSGVVCVTFLDRLQGDQVTPSKQTLTEWQQRPMVVLGQFIAKYFETRVQNGN
ncbi:hypothetical protein ABMA28_010281 [Loxostege sticticalis]|uniref:Nucleoside phosphorylase domain-containing protein n=1 Tax=Loxostege sticticalis TaxID=481309 RepID=A0ABD0SAA4_LOXSC